MLILRLQLHELSKVLALSMTLRRDPYHSLCSQQPAGEFAPDAHAGTKPLTSGQGSMPRRCRAVSHTLL